jgi:hypothetical protein
MARGYERRHEIRILLSLLCLDPKRAVADGLDSRAAHGALVATESEPSVVITPKQALVEREDGGGLARAVVI